MCSTHCCSRTLGMRIKSDKCSRCKKNLRAPSARYCHSCKAEYMRAWRPAHPMSEESKKRHAAHSYLFTYIKRGRMVKGTCHQCQSPDVHPYHQDPDKPLEVIWYCLKHPVIHLPLPLHDSQRTI